jgi:hypothetical protein
MRIVSFSGLPSCLSMQNCFLFKQTGKARRNGMELEDYLEPEIAVTAAVTAALFSQRGRQILRRGAVYSIAGVMTVGDAIASFARSVGQGFRQEGTLAPEGAASPEGTPQGQGGQA